MANTQSGFGFVKKSGDTMTGDLAMAAGKTVDGVDISAVNRMTHTDRGSLAAYDWETGVFTTDGTWRDLDLSAIVPAGAKLVHFRVYCRSPTVNASVRIKTKGYADDINCGVFYSNPANGYTKRDGFVVPDADRKVQYKIDDISWNVIGVLVAGWFV